MPPAPFTSSQKEGLFFDTYLRFQPLLLLQTSRAFARRRSFSLVHRTASVTVTIPFPRHPFEPFVLKLRGPWKRDAVQNATSPQETYPPTPNSTSSKSVPGSSRSRTAVRFPI